MSLITKLRFAEVTTLFKQLVKPRTHIERNLIYNELDNLANHIRRYYAQNNFSALEQLQREHALRGIFSLDLAKIYTHITIGLKSTILSIPQFVLVIKRHEDANTISRHVKKSLVID